SRDGGNGVVDVLSAVVEAGKAEPLFGVSRDNPKSYSPSTDQIPPRHRYFISRYSSIPYFEPSRPSPEDFMPPKGATSVEIRPVLIPTMPYSSASATRTTRLRPRA